MATNHFVDPGWEMTEPLDNPSQTLARYDNLLALGEKYRGRFNASTMMEVLDIPLSQGGVTRTTTMIQVVAVPERREIWVKVPGYQDWTGIDLSGLFGTGPSLIKAGTLEGSSQNSQPLLSEKISASG